MSDSKEIQPRIDTVEELQRAVKQGTLEEWVLYTVTSCNKVYSFPPTDSEIKHIAACLESLVSYKLGIYTTAGSFVQGLAENNFSRTVAYADSINLKYLWVYANYMYNYMPIQTKGE